MHIQTSQQQKLDLGFGGYSCNWGVHIAGLYETDDERDEIINGFLKTGVQNGDLQMYCPVEQTREQFESKLIETCPHCKSKLSDSSVFQIDSAKDLYYPQGTFSPIEMDKHLNAFYENSQKNGSRNIRAAAEMVWALEAIPGVEDLMAYESRLNYFIPNKPWISICLYNLTKFSGAIIMQVLQTHPYIINKGIITQNPYYIDPTTWLEKNAPEFLLK